MKLIYPLLLFLLLSFSNYSQTTLVSYNFTGGTGVQTTQATFTVGTNVNATPISRGRSATSAELKNGIGIGNWPAGGNLNTDIYFEFSVTPAAGYVLTLNQLIFGEENIGSGARVFAIRTSLDNFTNNVFTSETFDIGLRNRTVNLSPINVVNTITIRIYGFRRAGSNNFWGLKNNSVTNDMRLTGTSTVAEYVYTNGWSPANPEGVSTSINDVQIKSGHYTFQSNMTCKSLTVAPGNTITVNDNVIITAINGVMLQSVSNSFSGLILDGAIEGTINYSRFVNVIGTSSGGGNDLITPPLANQAFGSFANANSGVLAASNNIRAWAPFNNAVSSYQNYNTIDNSTTVIQPGVGYRAATIGGANLLFTGTANNSIIDVPINVGSGNFSRWNAIGNPYPSYIKIEDFLNHSFPAFRNIEKLDDDFQAIYGYNAGTTDIWDVINLANAGERLMAPGQGFFVAAGTATSLRFTPEMRIAGNGDDFIQGRNTALTFLKVKVTNGTQKYTTDIYFNDNASLGFDPGYDAKIWGGVTSGFKLYSHLVENNTGTALALQTLNTNDLDNVTIPLGINSGAGSSLIFSLEDFNLPGTVEVYLEDANNNTITRIDNGNHHVTLNQAVNGTGRFFLRLSNRTLSLDKQFSNSINIYHQSAEKVIVIAGALLDNTPAYLYDLQGRKVSTTTLKVALLEQRIDVSGLGTGIYILSFENGNERISKKLVIKE